MDSRLPLAPRLHPHAWLIEVLRSIHGAGTIRPINPMSYDVFISYSSPDFVVARRICQALEANRIRCWMAPRDVAAASHYSGEIIRGINECRALVLVVSPSANRSWHVLREVERAVSKRKHILPVRLQDIGLSHDLEYFISVVHWLDAFAGIESKLRELENGIRECLNTGREIFSARPSQQPPTPQGKMERFAHSWCATLQSLRETGAISEAELSNVLREVTGSDWSVPESDEEMVSRLLSDADARRRALIDGSDEDVLGKAVMSPTAASAHRVLYAIKTGLPLIREDLGIRFVLIPPGTSATSCVNLAPFYLSESLVSESQWNKAAGLVSPGGDETGRAKTQVSPQTALMFLERASSSSDEFELRLPTVEQWNFISAIGSNVQPDALDGAKLFRGKASAIGLHDLLGVAWQICRAPHDYQLRGGSYLRRLTPPSEEPPAIPCENTALCGEDVGLRLALVPKQQ